MARPIDADKLLDDITAIENSSGMGYIIASTFKRYVNQQPTLTPPNDPTYPCDLCVYNPPSSLDGKPCTFCPATGRQPEGEENT